MIFQILVGIWVAVSPLAFGFKENATMTINSLILGAIVAILGLVVALTGVPEMRHVDKKAT
jgi:hypothetical protein